MHSFYFIFKNKWAFHFQMTTLHCLFKAKYTKEKDTMMINHERELADRADKLREIKCRFD